MSTETSRLATHVMPHVPQPARSASGCHESSHYSISRYGTSIECWPYDGSSLHDAKHLADSLESRFPWSSFLPRWDRRSHKIDALSYSSREYALNLVSTYVNFIVLIFIIIIIFMSAVTCTYEINTFYTKKKEIIKTLYRHINKLELCLHKKNIKTAS